jgi:phosphoribosylformylglycinamidine cyclo-ligase
MYKTKYPESFDSSLDDDVSYIGRHNLLDEIDISYKNEKFKTNIGKLILSPTRSFLPFVKEVLQDHFNAVDGMIHCSGGGQTKCMKYMPTDVRVVKDNLLEVPPIFNIIQASSGADNKEMFQVFNMGCRLEIYTDEKNADQLISIANKYRLDGQIIGRVEAAPGQTLVIESGNEKMEYAF